MYAKGAHYKCIKTILAELELARAIFIFNFVCTILRLED